MVKLVNGLDSTYTRLNHLMAEIGAGIVDSGRMKIPERHHEVAKEYLKERGYSLFGYSMTDKSGNITIYVNRSVENG